MHGGPYTGMELTAGVALPVTERSSEPARSHGWYAGPTRQRLGRRASARKGKKTGPRRENRDWAENEVRAQLGVLSFFFLLFFYILDFLKFKFKF
jgi:hypothetical protein